MNYTAKELDSCTEEELLKVVKDYKKGKISLTAAELRGIIKSSLRKSGFRPFISQFKTSFRDIGYQMPPEQEDTLKGAFIDYDDKNLQKCRSLLKEFFRPISHEEIMKLGLSDWHPYHVKLWSRIIGDTQFYMRSVDSSAGTFCVKIAKQSFLLHPEVLKHQLWNRVAYEIEEFATFAEKNATDKEGCLICDMARIYCELAVMPSEDAAMIISGKINIKEVYVKNPNYCFK